MTLIKRTYPAELAPRFFDSFLLKDFLLNNGVAKPVQSSAAMANVPAVNVAVSEDAYTVELLAPGLEKEKFSISLEQDELTVAYAVEAEADQQKNYLLREFSTRSFSRSFTFPKGVVDEEKIEATYTNGVLHLYLPKREEAKPKGPRQISIA